MTNVSTALASAPLYHQGHGTTGRQTGMRAHTAVLKTAYIIHVYSSRMEADIICVYGGPRGLRELLHAAIIARAPACARSHLQLYP